MVTTEPENFVHLFCAVVYDLLRRVLQEAVVTMLLASVMGKTYPDVALGGHHSVHRTWARK